MEIRKMLLVCCITFVALLSSCANSASVIPETTNTQNNSFEQLAEPLPNDNLLNTYSATEGTVADTNNTTTVPDTTELIPTQASVSSESDDTTAQKPTQTEKTEESNLSYDIFSSVKYGEYEKNVMDIYVPKSAYKRKSNACILFIHGGSWTGGERSEMTSRCQEYANKGYVTATIDYRLYVAGSGVTGLSMLEDVDNAIRQLKTFSNSKKLNINKLATSGYSAGAHISMLYTYADTNADRGKELDFISPAIPIVFTANQVGPSDFRAGVWGTSESGDTGLGLGELLSGYKLTDMVDEKTVLIADEQTVKYALELVSPAAQVTSSAVPSLFGYGGKDYVVPSGNKESIVNACESAGIKYDLVMYPKSGHMLMFDYKSAKQYTKLLDEYCVTYFGY